MRSKSPGKMAKVQREFKAGTLHSGSKSGPKVKSKKQAIAIGLSEARKAGEGSMSRKRSMSDEMMLKRKKLPA